jgi:hypothetical protein
MAAMLLAHDRFQATSERAGPVMEAAWASTKLSTADLAAMFDHLPPGTHLTTPRRGFVHHGLYAGGGRVLHYGGLHRWLWRRPVEEVSLAQFARGRGVAVVATTTHARYDGVAAIERARSRLGEDRYRLWSNNCEHFVTWCLNGTPRSAQVDAWRARAAAARDAIVGSFWPVPPLRLRPIGLRRTLAPR